jgi:hypothetical protein
VPVRSDTCGAHTTRRKDEDFDVALSSPEGGVVLGSPAARIVTINDNDSGGGSGDDGGDSGGDDGRGLALLAAIALTLRERLMRARASRAAGAPGHQ